MNKNYEVIVIPASLSAKRILAGLRRDERFAEAKCIFIAREKDSLEPPWEALLTIRAGKDGSLSQEDKVTFYRVVKQALVDGEGTRLAFVVNGGSPSQAWLIFQLARLDGACYRDVFDVQRDGAVKLAD